MKKTIYLIAILISLSAASFAQPNKPGFTYNFVRGYCIGLGYDIGQEWNCPLEQGEYFTKTFTFREGVKYDIIALSEDNDVKDVDIVIYNAFGGVYTQDTSTDKYAEVSFTPSYTQDLTIKVKNYRSNTPYYASRVYFMVAYQNLEN